MVCLRSDVDELVVEVDVYRTSEMSGVDSSRFWMIKWTCWEVWRRCDFLVSEVSIVMSRQSSRPRRLHRSPFTSTALQFRQACLVVITAHTMLSSFHWPMHARLFAQQAEMQHNEAIGNLCPAMMAINDGLPHLLQHINLLSTIAPWQLLGRDQASAMLLRFLRCHWTTCLMNSSDCSRQTSQQR